MPRRRAEAEALRLRTPIIARGPVVMHFINGQLTAVLVDDDPASSNNWSGFFGFEIENTTRFEAKNVYVRKLN